MIVGGTGAEVLNGGGGQGSDTFVTGAGRETLNGGARNDTYIYKYLMNLTHFPRSLL